MITIAESVPPPILENLMYAVSRTDQSGSWSVPAKINNDNTETPVKYEQSTFQDY